MNIKSLLFSAFSIVAFLSSAQNFDYTPSQNIDEQIQEENFSFHEIRMITGDLSPIELQWNLIENTLPLEWSYSLCDLGGCYVGIPNSGIMDPITAQQAQDGFMGFLKLNITASTFYGEGDVIFYVHELGNPAFGDTVTMHISHPNPASSIVENGINSVEVYPNPVHSELQFKAISDIESCQVVGLNGEVYASFRTMSPEQKIDFSGFSSGVYFLRLSDSKGNTATQKVIKN
tara:strand:- start:36 stop:731 length:696 start_codon:yes stop_codon:yes gene_type:complete